MDKQKQNKTNCDMVYIGFHRLVLIRVLIYIGSLRFCVGITTITTALQIYEIPTNSSHINF